MNNQGLVFFYTFMLGITVIVLGIALATPLTQVITNAMTSTELNCSAPATDYEQATCWFLDIIKPLIVGFFILLGFAILIARRYVIT